MHQLQFNLRKLFVPNASKLNLTVFAGLNISASWPKLFYTYVNILLLRVLGWLYCQMTCDTLWLSFLFLQLIRKDGDYHSSRLLDGKDIQANQNMQPKKKHKKSSHKVKEKVEVSVVT